VSSFVLSEKWLIFTNSEMTDIYFMYGRAKSNASKATRLYHEAYIYRIADSQVEECLAKFNSYVRPDSSNQI